MMYKIFVIRCQILSRGTEVFNGKTVRNLSSRKCNVYVNE